MSGMVDGFKERAERVNELLVDPATSFLIVCGPQGEPIDEAVYFHRKLVEAKLPVGGVIVNKVHYETDADLTSGEVEGDLRKPLGKELAARVAANFADYQALAVRDAKNIDHLARELQCPGGYPGSLHGRGHPRPRRAAQPPGVPVQRYGWMNGANADTRVYTSGKPFSPQATNAKLFG